MTSPGPAGGLVHPEVAEVAAVPGDERPEGVAGERVRSGGRAAGGGEEEVPPPPGRPHGPPGDAALDPLPRDALVRVERAFVKPPRDPDERVGHIGRFPARNGFQPHKAPLLSQR